jgi:hypothetical protein
MWLRTVSLHDAAHLAWGADLILKYALERCLSGILHNEIKASYVQCSSYYARIIG